MKNKFTILIITLLIINITYINIYASVIPHSVVQFGRIEGINADYSFYIPISWKDYITISQNTNLDVNALECLDFYYIPNDKTQQNKLFFTLYVFDSNNYSNNSNFEYITEKNGYTFVAKKYLDNNYNNTIDNIIFSRFSSELNNSNFISNKINVTSNIKSNETYNNVYVNNKKLHNHSFVSSTDITYLPIREICELLNYTVIWNGSNKSVSVKKGDSLDVIYLRSKNTYTPVVIDGNVYMPTMYYINYLDLDVNIDSKNNVNIYN